MATLSDNQHGAEKCGFRLPHFQRVTTVENGGTSMCCGKREKNSVSPDLRRSPHGAQALPGQARSRSPAAAGTTGNTAPGNLRLPRIGSNFYTYPVADGYIYSPLGGCFSILKSR
jgi:hypothetical protein